MFCSKCGANIPDQSQMCPRCGTRPVALQPGATPPPPGGATAAPAPAPFRAPVGPQQTDGKAIGSLILGILSLFLLSILAGIPAVILGHLSRKSIRESMGRLKGEGMALAGLIMGYLSMASIPIVLIIAAIAIPSLLRARITANERAAAATVRTIVTSEVVYSQAYSAAGYASSLASLGPGQPPVDCSTNATSEHACLVDNALGCSGTWCTKNGYQFNVTATCEAGGACTGFVATATPLRPGTTGINSFCATQDGVVRVSNRRPLVRAPTLAQCESWPADTGSRF
jgi:hypothetical protein